MIFVSKVGQVYISKINDLTDKVFDELKVIKMIYDETYQSYSFCECICSCGKQVIKRRDCLLKKSGNIKSCGCKDKENRIRHMKTIVGEKYNMLLVLKELYDDEINKLLCRCDCGKEVVLRRNDVMSGHTKSCGCFQKYRASVSRHVDHTNFLSDYGITILREHGKNEKGQTLWECECGYCGNLFYELPARIKK